MKKSEETDALVALLQFVLNRTEITSENIGSIRRELFLEKECLWNGIVREETALRENKNQPA